MRVARFLHQAHADRRGLRGATTTTRSLGSVAEAVARKVAGSAIHNYIDESIVGDFPPSMVDVDEPIRPLMEVDAFLDGHNFLLNDTARRGAGSHTHSDRLTDVDPFELCREHIDNLDYGIKDLVGSNNALLSAVSQYIFDGDTGKKVRPVMVVLMSQAVRPEGSGLASHDILPSQLRLAEITEMIHTASLLHDDVIDDADVRRGRTSVNRVFGNKMSILAGDFLLARSSVALARLRDIETVELLSTVIEHLVKGEVMQINAADYRGRLDPMQYYMRKNYYKTGSLIANSCVASTLLGGCNRPLQEAAFEYGLGCGLAFQLVDDLLDFEGSTATLGKPSHNDIKHGLVTAPVLFAEEQFPQLTPLIKRKFESPGDVEEALSLLERSDGIERTRALAVAYAERAVHAVMALPDSPARDGLANLALKIAHRST